jgi:hypothetical protein
MFPRAFSADSPSRQLSPYAYRAYCALKGQQRILDEDVLADETVNGEPVSASDSLLTGNLTGNFSNLGLFLRFLLLINEQIQTLASKFPSKWNRELFLPNREFSRPNRELDLGSIF